LKKLRGVEEWLADIVRCGEKLARHIDGWTLETFLNDEKTQDAVAKCAEEIGGAAGAILKLEPNFDAQHPNLCLADAYNSRNRLSHGYYSINYRVLWNTASKSIPVTVSAAKSVLAQLRTDENRGNDGGDGSGGVSGGRKQADPDACRGSPFPPSRDPSSA
jgi:uncharacterized protein with HEPN domain